MSSWDKAEVWVVGAWRAAGSDMVEAKENNWSHSWPLEKPASAFIMPGMLQGCDIVCPEPFLFPAEQAGVCCRRKAASSRNNSDLRSCARWSSLRAVQGKDTSNPISIQWPIFHQLDGKDALASPRCQRVGRSRLRSLSWELPNNVNCPFAPCAWGIVNL